MRSLRTALLPPKRPQEPEVRDINRVRSVRIGLASSEKIRDWSFGEVKNPETIDYKTHKPKPDGLFCERIFGPTKDYECACGKFKGIKHKGLVCDRCGVELTQSKVRRSRLGHIELEMPVSHIWFSKGVPSRMAALLDLSIKNLERVLYYEDFIVIDPKDTPLEAGQILTELEELEARAEYGEAFETGMGAEAVKGILERMELDSLADQLRVQIRTETSKQRMKKATKRLGVVENFRSSGNRPEWMILEVLPVIAPDLRPLVPLEGGRFATSDLNDLYRRVINRNNRLRRLKEVTAPEVIIRNEKRMLQEAVDALLDNGRRGRPVKGSNNRPLKSLSDMLKGKQGRFRQNLLGKRVDYSGRSVIVVGPELKLHQCGLPKKMALELFEPFIIRRMEELNEEITIRTAKKKIEREEPEVFDVLEEVIKDHPILLNRAPTLHRLGIQAYMPILIEGKAIQLHPLSCAAFNADFDGDQMAVHIPLSREAQTEAKVLMLSTKNILSPSDGRPVATPSQDIVLGCYYLTKSETDSWLSLILKDPGELTQDEKRQMMHYFFVGPIKKYVDPYPRYKELLEKRGENEEAAAEKFTRQDLLDLQIWFALSRKLNDSILEYSARGLEMKEALEALVEKGSKFKIEDKDLFGISNREPFSNTDEALVAYDNERIRLQEEIRVRIDGHVMKTTAGRIIFNEALPEKLRFVNYLMDKKALAKIVARAYAECGQSLTALLLDRLKELGFSYAKLSGLSIGMSDLVVPFEKGAVLGQADDEVREIMEQFHAGAITDVERYNKIVDTWQRTTYDVASLMMDRLSVDQGGFNPVYMILNSGSRGSKDQISQLAGMRGVMNRPTKKMTGAVGEVIESPIKSNFKEGLTMLEYFISTHGARKGLADTALKTAEAGYLTRRLVDVAQDVIVNTEDCGTVQGIEVRAIMAGDLEFETLAERIVGRVSLEDIYNPLANEPDLIVGAGELVSQEIADRIVACGIETVFIRSVMTCEAPRGVCAKCYGWDLSRRTLVEVGEAVGVIAAQSIGEPGTQLTLRTFHIGGTTSRILRQADARVGSFEQDGAGFRLGESGHVKFINVRSVKDREKQQVVINRAGRMLVARSGVKADALQKGTTAKVIFKEIEVGKDSQGRSIVMNSAGSISLQAKGKRVQENARIPHGAELLVSDGSRVKPKQEIASWAPFKRPQLAEVDGTVRFRDVVEGKSIINEGTKKNPRWLVVSDKKLHPCLLIEGAKKKVLRECYLFAGAELCITDGQKVKAGDTLSLLDTPIVSEVEGKCRFLDIEEGLTLRKQLDETDSLQSFVTESKTRPEHEAPLQPRLAIVGKGGVIQKEYHVPAGYFLTVQEGDDIFGGTILARADQTVQEKFQSLDFLPTGSILLKKDGQKVERGEALARWDPYSVPIVAEAGGACQYRDMEQGVTYRLVKKEDGTEQSQRMIMEHREDRHPTIVIEDEKTGKLYHYPLPTGAQVLPEDGQMLHPGDVIAKIPQESSKSRDVTGGLPRVEEILEARKPKPRELSVISRYDGWVRVPQPSQPDEDLEKKMEEQGFRKKRGMRWILVMNNEGEILDGYKVDAGKHLTVSDGDWVQHGDKLVDGSIDPHEYLAVMGERRTQEYLLNEIQEVYRLQNVSISDKHVESMIRQMMRKVKITEPGDSIFLHDETEDRFRVLAENERVEAEGGTPAKFLPTLLGITKASLGTDSFISAASFQETTRVLTQAAISGRADPLLGLKENVIVGHLIPAGTGNPNYGYLRLQAEVVETQEEEDTSAAD